MEKVQFENGQFILYSPDSLKYITDNMYEILISKFDFYKKIFDIDSFRKVQINYFDDIETFRNFIYDLRGEKDSLPKYAKGTFDNGMINAYIEPNWLIGSPMYYKKLYMASHELFHIMYQEIVWKNNNQPRVVWFDEGMAQFFSGEFDKDLNEDNFDKWFNNIVSNTKEIPNLNELSHDNNFETDNYSGYILSLLAVKYLYEKLSFDEFKELMKNTDDIIKYGENVLPEAIKYYQGKQKTL